MVPESKVYVSLNELQDKVGATIEFTRLEINDIGKLIERIEAVKAVSNTWMLCGKNAEKENYVVLQVASAKYIMREIKTDLKRMPSYIPDVDDKSWNSFFYKDVFTVKYGLDSICQKYNHIYENYSYFCIVLVDYEKYLSGEKVKKELVPEYAEVKLACDYRAIYWCPSRFNSETTILNNHPEWRK